MKIYTQKECEYVQDLFNDWYTKELYTYFEVLIRTQYIPKAIKWIDAKNNPELTLKFDYHLQVHGYV